MLAVNQDLTHTHSYLEITRDWDGEYDAGDWRGSGTVEADEVIDRIYSRSIGEEVCWDHNVDWEDEADLTGDWIAGSYGAADVGKVCSSGANLTWTQYSVWWDDPALDNHNHNDATIFPHPGNILDFP